VPRHIWLSLAIVAATVLAGILLFDPKRPAAEPAAETQTLEGKVVQILAEERLQAGQGSPVTFVQTVLVAITRGERRGEQAQVRHGEQVAVTAENRVQPGDRVLVDRSRDPDGNDVYAINDFIRWPALLTLALLFAVALILVGGAIGLRALISAGFTVLIIAFFIVPGILAGHNALLICILGTAALMTATLYLTYGWTGKTHASLIALTIGLVITGLLSQFFVNWARLSGYGSESAMFLNFSSGIQLNLQGILLGGIVLGTAGVLDDVTTNQASVTFQLKRAAPEFGWLDLFRRSMVVGRDHIAAVVNTLLLAYVGASLSLLLLVAAQAAPLSQMFNQAFIAEEIVRTLTGSLGLILATPITSLIAGAFAQREARAKAVAAAGDTET
jgi:uncharacterized membrane protein